MRALMGGAAGSAKLRRERAAKRLFVSATATPYVSNRRRRIVAAVLMRYIRLASRSPRWRQTMEAIALCSRTKCQLEAVMCVWSTLLLRMDGSSPTERPKHDHAAALTG